MVTGIAPGTAIISYSISVDCRAIIVITVNPTVEVMQQPVAAIAFSLKPNPNNGAFTISGNFRGSPAHSKVTIEITDVLGEVVYRSEQTVGSGIFNKDITLNDNIANGIYLVKARVDGSTKVMRFTLKR